MGRDVKGESIMVELIDGTEVKMGGKLFIIPALNFKRLKKLKPELSMLTTVDLSGAMSDTQIEASITIIHTAVTRNYPDVTRDDIEELVDLKNMAHVMAAIMGQSGLVQIPGEAEPVAVT